MKKGFTLIELLIVIAIIGILAVAFLPSLLGAPAKARDTQRVAAVSKIQAFLVNKSLTGDKTFSDVGSGIFCLDKTVLEGVSKLINDNLADFGGVYPKDPQADTLVPGCPADGKGRYMFLKFDKASVKNYTGAVISVVEELNNANYDCAVAPAANTAPVLVAKGSIIAGDGVKPCYVSLFQ